MKRHDFCLEPFPGDGPGPGVKITGSITRAGDRLAVRYELRGNLAEARGEARYWEFNFSPSGDWNVYGFAGYRQGMAEAEALTALDVRVRRQRESLRVAAAAAVGALAAAEKPIEVGIAAVMQMAGGGLTYWALSHLGGQADFHRRDSFLVKLPGRF
jgi:hypothetical protein